MGVQFSSSGASTCLPPGPILAAITALALVFTTTLGTVKLGHASAAETDARLWPTAAGFGAQGDRRDHGR